MDDRKWQEAANKIAGADFLLLAAGAGFSADSGLPVYNDIAKVAAYEEMGIEYQDICDPYWLEEDEELFYGFWGSCFNAYRDTAHHHGYQILRKWKEALIAKQGTAKSFEAMSQRLQLECVLPSSVRLNSITNDPFFIYTSNVDGHFHRDFDGKEIYELHGSVETWQCAGSVDGNMKPPCDGTWTAAKDFRFAVDATTMRSSGGSLAKCPKCGGQGRPNVLMFHDKNWIPNLSEEDGYVAWEAVMEQMLQENPSMKLVVLEIGCGTRVPSVRRETEMVVADVFERCGRAQATLIRINPDFAHCDHPVLNANGLVLSIPTTGLKALESINSVLTNRLSAHMN